MPDYEFFKRTPGSHVAQGQSDPSMLLIGEVGVGDPVRLPSELGGATLIVRAIAQAPCPKGCGVRHKTFVFDDRYVCLECPAHGFIWGRLPEEKKG